MYCNKPLQQKEIIISLRKKKLLTLNIMYMKIKTEVTIIEVTLYKIKREQKKKELILFHLQLNSHCYCVMHGWL